MGIPKYQVFISSTFKNMEHARKAAIAGVADARQIPIALDSFAPQDASDLEVIKREVAECQVYIILLGPTYGKIPEKEEKSYTEIEFEHAEKSGRYIMVFTLHWEDVREQRKQLDLEADREELGHTERLRDFFAVAASGRHFHREWRWGSVEDIRRYVAIALTDLPHRDDAPRGWIAESEVRSEIINSVAENGFLRDTVSVIRGFEKLFLRTQANIDAKVRAAEFLAQRYHARMESEQTKGIFFESGSSVAFVAKKLPDGLWKRVMFGKDGEPSKRISTNNVLVYLHLWLDRRVPCAHFPWGPPEDTYGASYGPIGELGAREPNFQGNPINQRAKDAIASLDSSKLALSLENTSLIVTAASGLQLSQGHIIVCEQEDFEVPPDVREEVNCCFGPHVGSYQNKILKRYLYHINIPTVLVIDSSKINCPINVGKCHFIFGRDLPWNSVIEDHPLALCVGCPTHDLDRLIDLMRSTLPGFNLMVSQRIKKFSAVIARNAAFERQFPEQVTPDV